MYSTLANTSIRGADMGVGSKDEIFVECSPKRSLVQSTRQYDCICFHYFHFHAVQYSAYAESYGCPDFLKTPMLYDPLRNFSTGV